MRVSLVSSSGRELVSLRADPSWHLQNVLSAWVPPFEEHQDCRVRIFYGDVEFCGNKTLAGIGACEDSLVSVVE